MSTSNRQQSNDSHLTKALQEQLELSSRESEVLLELFKLGKISPAQLARRLRGIPRTSVYDLLKGLRDKGFVSVIEEGRSTFFIAEGIEQIIEALDRQKFAISQKQDSLRSVGNLLQQLKIGEIVRQPRVRYFEGKKGIHLIHSEVKRGQTETRTIADIAAISKVFPEILGGYNLFDEFPVRIVRKDLYIKNREAEQYILHVNPVTESHRVKWLPNETSFQTDTFIWEEHVAIIDYSNQLSGVIMDNPTIAQTFYSWFELMWSGLPDLT